MPTATRSLDGGDGDDRLVGGKGNDVMNGGAGNDTLVWNQGDGSDRASGDAGNDVSEVNGAPTLGDVFILDPVVGGTVKLRRTNLGQFTFDAATERFEVNGLGGNDSVTANDGVGAFTLLSLDGGAGADTINGSEGPDLILGGEANDTLTGGGGDDRIVGDRGADTMNGGAGDDTLVWNNGDATDVVNGDDGRDDVEVNGAPAAGDKFTVQPNGARIKFDRTNLVPFTIDIGSSETLHANGLGGDDTITVGEVGSYSVTASGGSGNDTLTGGGSSERFLGGSGADTINPGAGLDVVFGDDGDDQVDVRDRKADVAFGGNGNDSVVADAGRLDLLDGFEAVDRTPNVNPSHRDAAADHQRRHGEGEEGHSVDQGELPGQLATQLHRFAHSPHRQAVAGRAECRPPARSRPLRPRPRRLEVAQGGAGQGQQPPGRPQGPPHGSRDRLDGPPGQDRAELAAHRARVRHGNDQELGASSRPEPVRPRPSCLGGAGPAPLDLSASTSGRTAPHDAVPHHSGPPTTGCRAGIPTRNLRHSVSTSKESQHEH